MFREPCIRAWDCETGMEANGASARRSAGRRPLSVLVIVFAAAASFVAPTAPDARATEKVDVELILAIDVSASVDLDEAKLQRRGYVAALANPRLVRAVEA